MLATSARPRQTCPSVSQHGSAPRCQTSSVPLSGRANPSTMVQSRARQSRLLLRTRVLWRGTTPRIITALTRRATRRHLPPSLRNSMVGHYVAKARLITRSSRSVVSSGGTRSSTTLRAGRVAWSRMANPWEAGKWCNTATSQPGLRARRPRTPMIVDTAPTSTGRHKKSRRTLR